MTTWHLTNSDGSRFYALKGRFLAYMNCYIGEMIPYCGRTFATFYPLEGPPLVADISDVDQEISEDTPLVIYTVVVGEEGDPLMRTEKVISIRPWFSSVNKVINETTSHHPVHSQGVLETVPA